MSLITAVSMDACYGALLATTSVISKRSSKFHTGDSKCTSDRFIQSKQLCCWSVITWGRWCLFNMHTALQETHAKGKRDHILAGSTYDTDSRALNHGLSFSVRGAIVDTDTSLGGASTRGGRLASKSGVSARDAGILGGGVGFIFETVILLAVRDMTLWVCCCVVAARSVLEPAAASVGNPPSIRLRSSSILLRFSSSFLRVSSSSVSTDASILCSAGGDRRGDWHDGQQWMGRLSMHKGKPHRIHAAVYDDSECERPMAGVRSKLYSQLRCTLP